MRQLYLLTMVALIPLTDLGTSWLYGGGEFPMAATLRIVRDVSILVVGILSFAAVRLPSGLNRPIVIYFAFIAAYSLVGLQRGTPLHVVVGSAGTLVIPVLLFLVGHYCHRTSNDIKRTWVLSTFIAATSVFLGSWEIGETTFWTEIVRLPEYMAEVKGLDKELDPEYGLPWNFFGGVELHRRAAGLLAAPLAQGAFLAVIAVTVLAAFRKRYRVFSIGLAVFMLFGIWQSGTRGTLLVAAIGILGLLLSDSEMLKSSRARWGTAVLLVIGFLYVSYDLVLISVNFLDQSTIGHWIALVRNIGELPDVLVIGGGVGTQGAIASQFDAVLLGGGEGAFFSIAYQLGLPGALTFLWFYVNCVRALLLAARATTLDSGPFHRALAALMVAFTTTFIASEHILTLSGMATFWFLVGGSVRVARRAGLAALPPPRVSRANQRPIAGFSHAAREGSLS